MFPGSRRPFGNHLARAIKPIYPAYQQQQDSEHARTV
jgi:hypothetical protein